MQPPLCTIANWGALAMREQTTSPTLPHKDIRICGVLCVHDLLQAHAVEEHQHLQMLYPLHHGLHVRPEEPQVGRGCPEPCLLWCWGL